MSDTRSWLARFAAALESGAVDVAALFTDTGSWRDLVAFEGRAAIADLLKTRLGDVKSSMFEADGDDGWFSYQAILLLKPIHRRRVRC